MSKRQHQLPQSRSGFFIGRSPIIESMVSMLRVDPRNPYVGVEQTGHSGDDLDIYPYKKLAVAVLKQARRDLFTVKYRDEAAAFLMDPDNIYLAGLGFNPLTQSEVTALIKARSVKGAAKKRQQQATADAMNGVRA